MKFTRTIVDSLSIGPVEMALICILILPLTRESFGCECEKAIWFSLINDLSSLLSLTRTHPHSVRVQLSNSWIIKGECTLECTNVNVLFSSCCLLCTCTEAVFTVQVATKYSGSLAIWQRQLSVNLSWASSLGQIMRPYNLIASQGSILPSFLPTLLFFSLSSLSPSPSLSGFHEYFALHLLKRTRSLRASCLCESVQWNLQCFHWTSYK